MKKQNDLFKLIVAPILLVAFVAGIVPPASSFTVSTGVADQQNAPFTCKDFNVASPKHTPEAFNQRLLAFEINRGQTDKQVQFLARGSSYDIFLLSSGLTLTVNRIENSEDSRKNGRREEHRLSCPAPQPTSVLQNIVRLRFLGANPNPQVTALEALPGRSNYFIGRDEKKWLRNIPNYAKVKYGQVYPGVDVFYQSNQQQLRYDFVVAPEASVAPIQMSFNGVKAIRADANGDLLIAIEGGEFRLSKPFAYQELDGAIILVACRYVVRANHEIGFDLGTFDKRKPLIIDPTLSFTTLIGGSGDDCGNSISAGDPKKNIYVTGQTSSPDFPTTLGAIRRFRLGASDAFVMCYNTRDRVLQYSTYLGGNFDDRGLAIKADGDGNVYITGETYSDNIPITPDAFQRFINGRSDAFVTKLDNIGSLRYSSYLGGTAGEIGTGIAIDAAGNMYIAGATTSPDFPHGTGPFGSSFHGGFDAFLTKVAATGGISYSILIGGSGHDLARGVAVDDLGNAYVAGETNSADFFTTPAAFQTTISGVFDGFIAAVTADGSSLLYSTFLGGNSEDACLSIAVDSGHQAYVTGYTMSNNFPTRNAYQKVYNLGFDDFGPTYDVFVTKLDATGSDLCYSTYLGGTDHDVAYGIAVKDDGSAYITGQSGMVAYLIPASDFPITSDAFQRMVSWSFDVFVTEINTTASGSASLVYSTYFGGEGFDAGFGIVLFNGSLYLTGETSSSSFPSIGGTVAFGGGIFDLFLARFDL